MFVSDGTERGLQANIDLGDDERQSAIQLLYWHFRQVIFANMRMTDAPVFECPMAAKFELFTRMTV